MQLGLACDVRLATDDARLGLHEARYGFLPGMATFRLAKFIGLGRARRMALGGRIVDAQEAERLGTFRFYGKEMIAWRFDLKRCERVAQLTEPLSD